MAHLVTNPDVYQQLQAEIDTAIADGRASSPISDAEARKLPLLQACIKEGFRVWPPITGLMVRVSQTDAIVSGVRIPAGTNVAWSPWAAMRNQCVFGVDADMYRPGRWLQADAEQFQEMSNTVDLCFGLGRWGCLGRPIALIELNKMVVEVCGRPTIHHVLVSNISGYSCFAALTSLRPTQRQPFKTISTAY